jgi:hypothetical protein
MGMLLASAALSTTCSMMTHPLHVLLSGEMPRIHSPSASNPSLDDTNYIGVHGHDGVLNAIALSLPGIALLWYQLSSKLTTRWWDH